MYIPISTVNVTTQSFIVNINHYASLLFTSSHYKALNRIVNSNTSREEYVVSISSEMVSGNYLW